MKEKQRKTKIRIMSILAILLVGISVLAYATQNVKIKVVQTPNVDIILTKSKTQVELANFESDLKAELIKQKVMTQEEIDAGKLNISAVEAQTVETQEQLNWASDIDSSIGSVTFANNGKNVSMKGNPSLLGKNAIYIVPEGNQEQEFNFGYTIEFGDSFNAAGMLLRVQKNANGYLEGYMLSFNNSKWVSASGANAALWHFVYDNNNRTNFSSGSSINLIKGISLNKTGNLNVVVTDTDITINGGGLSSPVVYTFEKGKEYGNGYGFFSDHYSHGCSNIGYFNLTNINLQIEVVKKFTEVLQAPDWREGSARILINVEDAENEQFSNQEELTAIVSKLMNSNVYYIGWGTDNNKSQIDDLVQKNDNNGTYIANTSEEAIQATVEYIKSMISENDTNVIIAGEHVTVSVTSPIGGVTTPTDKYPDGVWRVEHDYNYYENPQGQYEADGMYTNNLINAFDNVGKYSIYCEDEFVTDIYAHRRPISAFNLSLNEQTLNLKSNSYDLDIEVNSNEYSAQKANNGIKNEKWECKKVNEEGSTWAEIPSTGIGNTNTITLDANTEYIIRLTVTDYQGVSTTSTKYVTTGQTAVKPIASFRIVNKKISLYENLQIIDESYDPLGAELSYNWVVKKQGVTAPVYTGNTPLTDFSTTLNSAYGVGKYTIELAVSKTVDESVITSEVFSQTIEVTDDTTAPIVVINPTTEHKYNEDINITVNLKDEESGLKSYKYALNKNNTSADESEYKEITLSGNESNQTVTIPANQWDEELYLHLIAENNAGVKTEERIVGKYYIEPTYKLVIQAIDSVDGNVVKNAKYNIQGEYEDGSIVEIASDVTTDKNGKITIEKAKLHKVIGLKIDNITQADGYEISEYKNVGIDTSSYNIVVDKSTTSSDVETLVSDDKQTLTIKVPLEKKQFELNITNIDSISGNYISKTVFVLKQSGIEIARGTTEDGKLTLKGYIAGTNTTGEYVLVQESVNNMYSNIGNATLKIKFDENGNVNKVSQKLFANNDAIEISDDTKADIIVKNSRKDTTSFSVNINVTEMGASEVLEGSTYKIKVEGEDGLEYTTKSGVSDSNGNITIDGLFGTGLLRLTFINESAPNGYKVDTANKNIAINRKLDQTIEFKSASTIGMFDKVEGSTIYVKLNNELKSSTNSLKIRVLLGESENTGIDNVSMKVYRILDNTLVGSGVTDENGLFEIEGITADGRGEVLYKLVPDDNTVIESTILFTIGYNENIRIISASGVTDNENINIYYSQDDDKTYYKYTANVDIKIGNTQISGTNKLIITKQDSQDGKKIANAQYQVKILTTSMVTNVFTTDVNGKIETYLPDTNNIIVQLKEIEKPEGYRADSTLKTIGLTRNSEGKLQITSLNNISEGKVAVDENGNLNVIEESRSLDAAAVVFKIATVNSDETLNLGGVHFKVVEETTGYEETVVSNANGYVSVGKAFETTQGMSYIFEITETETVYPYVLPENSIKVQVRFTKDGTVVKYLGTSYLQGSELLKEKKASYDAENNQVDISLKVINKLDGELSQGRIYDIDITKVDKNQNVVTGSKYDIEIRPYAESSITSIGCEVDSEVEVLNLAIKQDKTTIILKEVNPAIGCNLDSDIKVVTIGLDENGKIQIMQDTTSSENISVELVEDEANNKTILKITMIAEEQTASEETPSNPGSGEGTPDDSDSPDEPLGPATVTLNLFNRRYGNWVETYQYRRYERNRYYKGGGYWGWYWYLAVNETRTQELSGAQRLLRIFNAMKDSDSKGFTLINAEDIKAEVRLVNNGIVDSEVYETVSAESIEANDKTGTHKVELYKEYANKTVEITLIENIPAANYMRNTTNAKFILKFDSNGNVKSGEITQGIDLEEIAIGGISAEGIINDIQVLRSVLIQGSRQEFYDTYHIEQYNSIGSNNVYIGLLNKSISNPIKINVNLKDKDTDEDVNGPVSVIVMDSTNPDESKVLETKNVYITGTSQIQLSNTYANRKLTITIQQTSSATKDNLKYANNSSKQIQFEVETDDEGNIKVFKQIDLPDHVTRQNVDSNVITYTIYNEIIYNFALNLTKLDENNNPLQGVRIRNKTSLVVDPIEWNLSQIFTYGSGLTDENGNVKLKIVLPTEGTYKYYGKTIEIELDEYYVPDNYRAQTGMKIRVLFDNSGNIADYSLVLGEGDNVLSLTGKNNIAPSDIEKISLDLTMVNSRITEKPVFNIENVDLDDDTIKLAGTKYQVSVQDVDDYAKNSLQMNETKYSLDTDNQGNTSIKFDNAHALRTMIYRIKEVQTANSYTTNEDIVIKVQFDEEGKIVKKPEIISKSNLWNSKNQKVDVVQIVGNPIGSTTIQLKIVNELKPKFTINISRRDHEGDILDGKEFKVIAEEKDANGNYTQIEERISQEKKVGYEVGFKQNPASKTIAYTIYEKTADVYTQRGKIELTFDMYGNILEGTATGRYIKNCTTQPNVNYINVTIEAEIFKMSVQVEDTDEAGYSLAGYTFKITNSKGEVSNVTTKTNSLGNVIEIVGECYKGETVTYHVEQIDSPLDYNDIEAFDLTIEFNEDGTVKTCTPQSVDNVYDLITTEKQDDIHLQIKVYTTAAIRNIIKMNLEDEDNSNIKLSNSAYEVDDGYIILIENGIGQTDLGSYKKYANSTQTFTIKQTQADEKYMINDTPIQIAVTFNEQGIIEDARIIASDGYVEIDNEKTIGMKDIVLKAVNRRKEIMQLEVHSTQSEQDKVPNAQFKIIEQNKSNLYSDTKTTDINGEATLYVGPYYREMDVTYLVTNTIQSREFKKVPDASFTLTYDSEGKVSSYYIPENMQSFMKIEILNNDTADIKITMQIDPLLTIGVNAVDNVTGSKLVGGKYEIQQVNDVNKKDTVITNTNSIAHAAMGETVPEKTVQYNIVEKEAPIGYKYINKDNIIGVLELTYDVEGKIIPGTAKLTQGYNYISINQTTDKNSGFDIDLQITYEEIEEFKIIIENYNIMDNTQKISSIFSANLTNQGNVSVTTDAVTGIGMLNFGAINNINSTQTLTISQSNVPSKYTAISPIRIRVQFDESGKIKTLDPVSGGGIAQLNTVYTIDSTGSYTIKITVKNNPRVVVNITNVSDGTNEVPLSSTMVLSGGDIAPVTMTTQDGKCSAILTTVPKNKTVTYTIAQTSVQRGYTKNKDIRLVVNYDNDGKILNAHIDAGSSNYADLSVVQVTYKDEYQIDLKIKNKTIFEVYIEARDAWDQNIKLSNVSVSVKETKYSDNVIRLTTDSNGLAHSQLASTYAGSYLDYEVDIINNLPGYDRYAYSVEATVRVWFDDGGNVKDCTSSDSRIEVKYGNGNAIELTIKYTPVLTMNITRRNTTNNTPLAGKNITIDSEALSSQGGSVNRSTDGNGKIQNIAAGLITAEASVQYEIEERPASNYTIIEDMGTQIVTVKYDSQGRIADIIAEDSEHVITSGKGTRTLNVEIGSDAKSTITVVNNDYYSQTERLSGKFEIKSSKGESMTISSSTDTTDVIEKLGKLYPGETIEYTVHQIETQHGYQTIPDTIFKVEYSPNGTIKTVTSLNTDVLEIKKVNQTATKVEANIEIEIHSKPILFVNIKVLDKQYNSGVYGLGFKIKDEESGYETVVESITDENGNVTIPVDEAYENKHVTYTITQTKSIGGYKTIPTFQVVVQYGDLGTVVENGTYVINTDIASITQGYTEDLYTKTKLRGIQLKIEAETQLGIGIEKTDVYGNKMSGIEFTISSKDVTDGTSSGVTKATNEAGEITHYLGDLPKGRIVEYTISEVVAPKGYRKIDDIVIRVYFDNTGRITSYTPVNVQENVSVEVATSDLYRMADSKEAVHIKLKLVNDNRVTFKIVNTQNNVDLPIQGAEFEVSVETKNGTILNKTTTTNINGEIALENIDANGTIKLFFNQLNVPLGYAKNIANQGFISINKSEDIYKLTYNDSTDNLDYNIDSEKGIVTIYLKNDNNLVMNLYDVDSKTRETVTGATHTIIAQYGEISDTNEAILKGTDNVITYNNKDKYVSNEGSLQLELGNTYNLANKKVIYTIETPDSAQGYSPIGKVYIVVEFDSKGRVNTVNGISSRLVSAIKGGDNIINTVIGYGDIDFYTIKVVKESNSNTRIDGVKFNIGLEVDGNYVEDHEGQVTGPVFIGDNAEPIENGVTSLTNLKYEGNMKVILTETEVPEGYDTSLIGKTLEVEFEVGLDKTDPDNIKLNVDNVNSENAKVEVNSNTREITITITNSQVIKFKLNKSDENGNLLTGMKFNLTVQEKDTTNIKDYGIITTDGTGTIEANLLNQYINKTIIIRLDEQKDANYQQIDPIIMEIYINEYGKMQTLRMTSGSDNATVAAVTENSIEINVVNKLEEFVKPYEINITKVDAKDNEIKLANVLFQIKVSPATGISTYTTAYTDENGNVKLQGLVGSGEIELEVKEVITPDGYIVGGEDGYFYYKVTKLDGSLQKVSSNAEDDLWNIDNDNKIINIVVENETQMAGIAIEKVDSKNNNLKLAGATLKLRDISTGKEYEAITNNSGIAYFKVEKRTNIVQYELQEIKAPEGYELDTSVKTIYVQYNEDGKISNTIESDGLTLLEKNDNYIKEQLSNDQTNLGINTYNLEIINIDKENNSTVIADSVFNVDITQSIGATQIRAISKTDVNGMFKITDLNGAGEIKVTLTNTLAGLGYVVNNNDCYLTLNRDVNTGTIVIGETNNVSAEYDPSRNVVRIYVESAKELNKYSLKLNIIDRATGELITDETAKFKLNINGADLEKNVDSQGQIVLTGLDIPNVKDFNIIVEEQQKPIAYTSIKDKQQISVNVANAYDIRSLRNAEITLGNNIQLKNTSYNSIELNLIYDSAEESNYYIKSDEYTVTTNTIERVKADTTVEEFMNNIDTNGNMKVYDQNGNEKTSSELIGTGDILKSTYDGVVYEYQVAVLGDLDGNGKITATDISMYNQVLVGKISLTDIQQKAADLDFNGKVTVTDFSTINKVFVGIITL